MYEALQIVGFFTFCWVGLGLFIYGFLKHLKHQSTRRSSSSANVVGKATGVAILGLFGGARDKDN